MCLCTTTNWRSRQRHRSQRRDALEQKLAALCQGPTVKNTAVASLLQNDLTCYFWSLSEEGAKVIRIIDTNDLFPFKTVKFYH